MLPMLSLCTDSAHREITEKSLHSIQINNKFQWSRENKYERKGHLKMFYFLVKKGERTCSPYQDVCSPQVH
jgi:hypothetical protein